MISAYSPGRAFRSLHSECSSTKKRLSEVYCLEPRSLSTRVLNVCTVAWQGKSDVKAEQSLQVLSTFLQRPSYEVTAEASNANLKGITMTRLPAPITRLRSEDSDCNTSCLIRLLPNRCEISGEESSAIFDVLECLLQRTPEHFRHFH